MSTKVIKFGGKSLANGSGLSNVLEIISQKNKEEENLVVVVSARGNTTNLLEQILEQARNKKDYSKLKNVVKQINSDYVKLYDLMYKDYDIDRPETPSVTVDTFLKKRTFILFFI